VIHIPSLPSDFEAGNAKKERLLINQRLHDCKTKTAFAPSIPTIHFPIGVAHWAQASKDVCQGQGLTFVETSSTYLWRGVCSEALHNHTLTG